MTGQHVIISKLDAAKRQLETAIIQFFSGGDAVSIHTLASAAGDILRDLGKVSGEKTIFDELIAKIRKDKRKEVLEMINKPKKFFKHANKDPLEQLKFFPEADIYTLFFAVQAYSEIKGEITPIMMAYRAYFYLKNPEILIDEKGKDYWKKIALQIDLNDKKQFIELIKLFELRKMSSMTSLFEK